MAQRIRLSVLGLVMLVWLFVYVDALVGFLLFLARKWEQIEGIE